MCVTITRTCIRSMGWSMVSPDVDYTVHMHTVPVNVIQQFVCRFFCFARMNGRMGATFHVRRCVEAAKVIRGITNEVEIFKLHFLTLGTV